MRNSRPRRVLATKPEREREREREESLAKHLIRTYIHRPLRIPSTYSTVVAAVVTPTKAENTLECAAKTKEGGDLASSGLAFPPGPPSSQLLRKGNHVLART